MDIKSLLISKFGGVSALAKKCGISHSAVSQWVDVPLHHIPAIIAAAQEEGFKDINLALFYPEISPTKQKHRS
jgi:DNA-binding transcriptional regulator YdaS (Cro superfamily)